MLSYIQNLITSLAVNSIQYPYKLSSFFYFFPLNSLIIKLYLLVWRSIVSLTQEQINKLTQKAIAMSKQARAPFSKYNVEAAILCDDDTIIGGCNIENVSYSLTECAERVALFSSIAQGCKNIKALAVATENLGSPCGACRQVIWELCGDIPIYLVDFNGNSSETSSGKLLPNAFKLEKE